ncbi:hypothetical protein D3C73_1340070 [compost metagenome]
MTGSERSDRLPPQAFDRHILKPVVAMYKRPIVLDPFVANVVFWQQIQDTQTGVEMPHQCNDTEADVSLAHPHFIGEVRHLMVRELVVQGDRAQQLLLSQSLEFRVAT